MITKAKKDGSADCRMSAAFKMMKEIVEKKML